MVEREAFLSWLKEKDPEWIQKQVDEGVWGDPDTTHNRLARIHSTSYSKELKRNGKRPLRRQTPRGATGKQSLL